MYFLRATRALIAAASSLHIVMLSLVVRLADNRAERAWKRADGVAFIVARARQLVASATEDHKDAKNEARALSADAVSLRKTALIEAQSLRPGVINL